MVLVEVLDFRVSLSINLSFKPNLHSGIPERYARIKTWPDTSLPSIVPILFY